MSNISTFSTTAGSNNSSPPNGWPEGMARSAVNDTARELYAALAKWYQDQRGSLVTAGGTTAYTLTTNNAHASLAAIPIMAIRWNAANTGAVTLAVDGLTAKSVVKHNGTALASGDISANQLTFIAYNPNLDRFEVAGVTPNMTAAAILALLLTVDGAGSGLDADLLDGVSSAAFMTKAANLSDVVSAATAFANIKQAASTTATGVAELAIASEMVTGTDAARVPSVSVVKNHPGVAKAWGKVNSDGTLLGGYNITSSVRNGTGDYTVTIADDMSNADYAVVVSSMSSECFIGVVAQAAGTFQVISKNESTVEIDVDFHFIVFGTLA